MANASCLGMLSSVYILVGLSNCLQVLVFIETMQRGLQRDPEAYRKFLPEILIMENLIERVGWPLLLTQFILFWPLFLRSMLIGWLYLLRFALAVVLRRALTFILMMGGPES